MRSILLFPLLAVHIYADVFYVNVHHAAPAFPYGSPDQAATNLASVMPLAGDDDIIYFATGTYQLATSILVTNDITFISTNPPDTVIIDGAHSTGCFAVESGAPEFSGLTIRNGSSDLGGAMRFHLSSAIISNCIIRDSRAKYGGGIYADQSPISVLNCIIQGNSASNSGLSGGINWPQTAGGGLFFKTSSARVMDSVIEHNAARMSGEGGGIAIFHPEFTGNGQVSPVATTEIINCLIVSNATDYTGGGTACLGINFDIPLTQVTAWFERCRWEENFAPFGGAFYHVNPGTESFVINSLFLRNRSGGNGAALRIFDTYYYPENRWARCTVLNSTFIDNQSTNNHTIYVSDSIYYMANNIVWSNQTLTDIRVDTGNSLASYQEAEYNCFEREYDGKGILQDGNITNQPLFVDSAIDDFRLTADSPCIDTGLSSRADFIDSDYFGDIRIFGNAVDMGFDEAVVSMLFTHTNNASVVTAYCPPGAILVLQQSDDGFMSGWQDYGTQVTSLIDHVNFDIPGSFSNSAALRAVWYRP